MAKPAVVIDPAYLKHLPGDSHPERPERIQVLLDLANALEREKFNLLAPRAATRAEIEGIHEPAHVRLVESTSSVNHYALDGDTITSRDSFAVSVLAAGGFLRLLDSIAAKESSSGFALVRPPGHHASFNRAMGFCLFNTIAIGAAYLKKQYGAKKILIMDWDVHHGNGTQSLVEQDASIRFVSMHQYPWYPGTGAADERGVGNVFNVPRPPGLPRATYVRDLLEAVDAALAGWTPDALLISAGFDSLGGDPLGGFTLTPEDIATWTAALRTRLDGRPVAAVLEGGYRLDLLAAGVTALVRALA